MAAVMQKMPVPPSDDSKPEEKLAYLQQCMKSGGALMFNYAIRQLAAMSYSTTDQTQDFKHAAQLLAAGRLQPLDQITFAGLVQMRMDELKATVPMEAKRGLIRDSGVLLTRVTVETDDEEDDAVASYVVDHNDMPQRLVLMEQIHNALRGNQAVYVYPERP